MSDNSSNPLPPPQAPVYSGLRTSTTAIVSLIAGIAGALQILPIIGPIVAIITGHMAKKEIKNGGGMVTGNGMATAGLIMGYVTLALLICGCIIAIIVIVLVAAGLFTIPWNTSHFSY